ncbi:hypothetical protein TPHA_0B01360 [Tetrapisispora phaffii CBS 4417]|uniref:Uncharacterized protein n=1 Tax=Tetrapisispora phaffii (strain ATCC 24235 / CBS 4417 / NBRC 1672 / NRRL Y-8282 / UCD 70-5) TaxID=1071381 RepID=G8BP78_TETPH|nr:hypothetical protein TPHA_0B01360 [Tetrapisispora phaffii CBS 4417]CCE61809.1 hypothetical protein TPHA_0B01360 [Tetrapisispora phaffii CBS 4417]
MKPPGSAIIRKYLNIDKLEDSLSLLGCSKEISRGGSSHLELDISFDQNDESFDVYLDLFDNDFSISSDFDTSGIIDTNNHKKDNNDNNDSNNKNRTKKRNYYDLINSSYITGNNTNLLYNNKSVTCEFHSENSSAPSYLKLSAIENENPLTINNEKVLPKRNRKKKKTDKVDLQFVKLITEKLNRYDSRNLIMNNKYNDDLDYFDKVRFQEILYKFSKTYF